MQRTQPVGATDPEQGKFDQFKPASEAPAEHKPVRGGLVVAAVVGACVALLAIAFGLLNLVGDAVQPDPSFAVGDCVKQVDQRAVPAECGEADAFTVVSTVSSNAQCEDKTQPTVQIGDQVLCLQPSTANGAASDS